MKNQPAHVMIRDSLVNLILQQRNLDWTQHVFQDKDVVVMVFMDPVEDEKKFQAWKEDAWPCWILTLFENWTARRCAQESSLMKWDLS